VWGGDGSEVTGPVKQPRPTKGRNRHIGEGPMPLRRRCRSRLLQPYHVVHPYRWLLDRVGTDSITLTSANYLPPVHVEAVVTELGLGKNGSERKTARARLYRCCTCVNRHGRPGFLRMRRAKLLLTAQGRALRGEPLRLWWRLAENTPPRSTDACETQANLIFLVATAAEITSEVHAFVADLLGAIGWMSAKGTPLTDLMASHATWNTAGVLRRLGGFTGEHDFHQRERPTQAEPDSRAGSGPLVEALAELMLRALGWKKRGADVSPATDRRDRARPQRARTGGSL
jgi:hypothetical protein